MMLMLMIIQVQLIGLSTWVRHESGLDHLPSNYSTSDYNADEDDEDDDDDDAADDDEVDDEVDDDNDDEEVDTDDDDTQVAYERMASRARSEEATLPLQHFQVSS